MSDQPRGPVDALVVPRFAGPSTFARLPRLDEVARCDVAIVGIPFDSGVTYRPGARFGPGAIREGSKLLRPYHPDMDTKPFALQQVTDAGDIACNPFIINEAISQIESGADQLLASCNHLIALGGDHTIALPLLRATRRKFGPLAVVHFDTHLDTWQGHFGVSYNHGTPFRRASEEGLLRLDRCIHVGVHASIYSDQDLLQDAELGFQVVTTMDVQERGIDEVAARIHRRVGDAPMYVSVDIDVLDPAHAPGTGTPEAGGMSTRELLALLRRLVDLNLVGADIVEVAPAYDHAEITAIAAAHVAYELLAVFARRAGGTGGKVRQGKTGARAASAPRNR
ncbi:MAG: agmatinase [Candidatus Dormibacteraeota bacterium]|nr:agmatinase [Candidatus Dormibacteraeota bacterium]